MAAVPLQTELERTKIALCITTKAFSQKNFESSAINRAPTRFPEEKINSEAGLNTTMS